MANDDSDNEARTLYVGNLSERITEAILRELFFQVS